MERRLQWINGYASYVEEESCEQENRKYPPMVNTAGMDRHVKATGGVQEAESSGVEVPGRESPVEAPDWEQETKPSCAEICAGEAGSDQASEEVPG